MKIGRHFMKEKTLSKRGMGEVRESDPGPSGRPGQGGGGERSVDVMTVPGGSVVRKTRSGRQGRWLRKVRDSGLVRNFSRR